MKIGEIPIRDRPWSINLKASVTTGYCNHDESCIVVGKKLQGYKLLETLLHETLEAVKGEGLVNIESHATLDEVARILSDAVWAVFLFRQVK